MGALAIKMTGDGQVTIPADIRHRLGWVPGKEIFLEVISMDGNINSFTGRPRAPYGGIDAAGEFAKSLGHDGRTTEEWMRELREGERE